MKIAIIGHGGCGKDTAAVLLARETGLKLVGSISWWMKEQVAERMGTCSQAAWEERRRHRVEWRDAISAYRAGDPGRIIREMFAAGDIITGPRLRAEWAAARAEGLPHLAVWVERQVPHDPTLELGPDDCDVILDNRGGKDDLIQRVAWLVRHYVRCPVPPEGAGLTAPLGSAWPE